MLAYDYSGHKWIPIKHFKHDATKSILENYQTLKAHHVEETTFLINEVRKLAARLNELRGVTP